MSFASWVLLLWLLVVIDRDPVVGGLGRERLHEVGAGRGPGAARGAQGRVWSSQPVDHVRERALRLLDADRVEYGGEFGDGGGVLMVRPSLVLMMMIVPLTSRTHRVSISPGS